VTATGDASFEPKIVAKRRLTGVEDMVISLSAKGLTPGEIAAHLAEVYGAKRPSSSTHPYPPVVGHPKIVGQTREPATIIESAGVSVRRRALGMRLGWRGRRGPRGRRSRA
jgi:hypothetical protein